MICQQINPFTWQADNYILTKQPFHSGYVCSCGTTNCIHTTALRNHLQTDQDAQRQQHYETATPKYRLAATYRDVTRDTIVAQVGEPSWDIWWQEQCLDGRIVPVICPDGRYMNIPRVKLTLT